LAPLLAGYLLARYQDGRLGLLLAAHVGAITLGYTGSLLVGFLAICYVMRRPFRDLSSGQMQSLGNTVFTLTAVATVLTFTGVLLGCVWAKDHLGRYWGWDPKEMGGACVLAWDLAMLLLWRYGPTTGRIALWLGILGNIVVSFAWFAGAPRPVFMALLVFGFLHIALFGLGFLPAGRCRRAV
ncbi:MAG TPA: cytochrome c biogenesis protein CcsA, partial [Gemmataceae bacterium]